MGARGPAPKRMQERLGHVTKGQKAAVSRVRRDGIVRPWRLSRDERQVLHPIALKLWNSLKDSGETQFWEPSDWGMARLALDATDRSLKQGERFSAVLFAAAWSSWESLLTTESARRRARVEVERGHVEEKEGPTAIEKYRTVLAQ